MRESQMVGGVRGDYKHFGSVNASVHSHKPATAEYVFNCAVDVPRCCEEGADVLRGV